MKTSIRFPDSMAKAAEKIAARRFISFSDVVREALQVYLELDATRRRMTEAHVQATAAPATLPPTS
jgi:Arc/MetJ-type ribon-helix-helix transcriptional regulator